MEAFLKAEIISPDYFWTIRRIATCYRNMKKPEMALSYYHRAEKIQPENLSVQMNIGHCYVEQKDYEEALKYYFKVDYLDPEGGKAWRPIAWCSFLVGKKEQAQFLSIISMPGMWSFLWDLSERLSIIIGAV